MLVRRGGEVVTREEIHQQVWHGDTFVDFDQGLNFCIRQIREALGDNADSLSTSKRSRGGVPRRARRIRRHGEGQAADSPDVLFRIAARRRNRLPRLSLPDALTNSLSGLESLVVRSSLVAALRRGCDGSAEKSGRKRKWTSSSRARCWMPVTGSR